MKSKPNLWPKLFLAALFIVTIGLAPNAAVLQRAIPETAAIGLAGSARAQASPGVSDPGFISPDNDQFIWAKGAGGTDDDWGHSIVVDELGNVYTTGMFVGTADFDPGPGAYYLTGAGGWDAFVSKLDSAGNFLWAKELGGSEWDSGQCIFVDEAGDVYTTGWFEGTVDFDPGAGFYNLTAAGGWDIFISKLDSAGDFIWARALGGTSDDEGQSVFVDAEGNIYTTGIFGGIADFDPGPATFNLTSAGSADIFVSKLDSAGHFVWAKAMGGIDLQVGVSLLTDKAGEVYTAGYFESAADFDPGPAVFNLTSTGVWDIFVSKLDAAGSFVWAKAWGGTFDDQGMSISLDKAGNVYTTGLFQGAVDFDPGPGTFMLISADGSPISDVFVSKLDSAGDFIWAKALGGADQDDAGMSIFVEGQGDVYTTGYFRETADFDPGAGVFNLSSAGPMDVFISKLDSMGDFGWARALGGSDWEDSSDIFVDGAGNVYTTGGFFGTADFDPGPGTFNLTSAGDSDVFISKLGVAARILVANQAVRSGEDIAITLTIKNQGPADGSGAQLSIPVPANASGFTWTCSAGGGAACPASGGSGDILDILPAFPPGGRITYLATGKIIHAWHPVASHGILAPPLGVSFTGSPRFHFGEYWNMRLPWIFVNASP